MLRIDFYVLQAQSHQDRLQFAVRLAEKAWAQNCTVVFRVSNEAAAQALDRLLWEYKPESFLPHGRPPTDDPMVVTTDTQEIPTRDLLINLGQNLPAHLEQFQRLAEIVIQVPDILEQTRRRYGIYKDMGHTINTHKLP